MSPRTAGLVPSLLAAAGLSFAAATPAALGTPPSREQGPPEKGRSPAMLVVRGQESVIAAPGDTIDVVVTTPVGVPHELRIAWPETPAIDGDAVRFIRRRLVPPPPEVDGGVTEHHYELAAVAPGKAAVVLEPTPASRQAPAEVIRVVVSVESESPPRGE